MADMLGVDRRKNKGNKIYKNLKMGNIPKVDKNVSGWWRYIRVVGEGYDYDKLPNVNGGSKADFAILDGNYPNRKDGEEKSGKSQFSQERYKYFLDAPFEISPKCCNVMKKAPAHEYGRRTGRKPFIATMASESKLRTASWIRHGCNGFDMKTPTSTPMSFWTEQDVLLYIKLHNLPICSVYGDVVVDYEGMEQVDGQMDLSDLSADLGIFDTPNRPLKTTGCKRTGCMLCGFGCHLEKSPNRFEMLKETHRGMYNLLDVVKNNGVTMREAIDWINEHDEKINIKY